MDRPRTTVGDLIRSLRSGGLLAEAGAETIAKSLAGGDVNQPLPWYLQVLLGAGAWTAAASFVVFIGSVFTLGGETALFFLGLLMVAAAAALRRLSSHVFASQFALAMSVTGHILIFVYVGEKSRSPLALAATSTALAAVLYSLYKDPLHRFLSVGAALALWIAWILRDRELHHGLHLAVLVEVGGLALFSERAGRIEALRPAAYAFAAALPATLLFPLFPDLAFESPMWPSRAVVALGLLGLVIRTAGKENLRREPVVLALAAIVLLGLFTAPGILAALGLLVLGYARREGLLVGLGALSLALFIVMFYYDLDMDLGTKSAVMAGSGLLLLAARALLVRRPWARREAT